MLKFLLLEPFFGGSHREFAEGLAAASRHHVDVVTMPARFWKWRMRAAALHFSGQVDAPQRYDGLITTDLMCLPDLQALWRRRCPPAMVYFHENQLTYPVTANEQRDLHFGFTNILTALAADQICFNSHYQQEAFCKALPDFLRMMPDCRPHWVIEAICSRAKVLYPGCRFADDPRPVLAPLEGPPLIIWNHRWEFDKGPEAFFAALDAIIRQGIAFRLALLGERFATAPACFKAARDRYGERIVQFGFVQNRSEYIGWLQRGAVVVSTARQENFGLAVVEAARHGCLPLLPRCLSYPEIMPSAFPVALFYEDHQDLVAKLAWRLKNPAVWAPYRQQIAAAMNRFGWQTLRHRYDRALEQLADLLPPS